MTLSARSLGFALLLLLLFLGAAVTLQWWSAREMRRLQSVALEEQRARMGRVMVLGGLTPEKWDATWQAELGALLGGQVELLSPGMEPTAEADGKNMVFTQELPGAPGWRIWVQLPPSAILRAEMLHQRTLTAIILIALLVALVPLLLALINTRRPASADTMSRSPWAVVRAQASGMEQLAKISHERTTALAQEHGARMRAEENLEVNRDLLDRSLAERVRLGRELHDNICQTLYAVCLTLESVQKKGALIAPLQERVDQCMRELKRLNQEVRAYLEELEPTRVQEQTFTAALGAMLATFVAEDHVKIDQRLDDEAVALLAPHQTVDILNILREAVSNGIRHGAARHITVRAGRSDREVALSVQDDGAGFAPATQGRAPGHGLANMQARALGLGGQVRIESNLGKGTRVLLTLPVASTS